MPDFKLVKIPNFNNWVISAPKRSRRPDLHGRKCVFCPGNGHDDIEVYRIPARNATQSVAGGGGEDHDQNWKVRVIENKYPFAPIHDVVVLTPGHIKNISEVPLEQFRLGIEAYVNRFLAYEKKGSVCIFGNAGRDAGESIGHPHAQIAVIPDNIDLEIPKLERDLDYRQEHFKVGEFLITCPPYAQHPDESWIVPLERGKTFADISYKEIESLAYVWQRLLKIMILRHGGRFAHNFYIYPYKDWYIRIIPRDKLPGGFEMMTGIYVNTQDPKETMEFIREHFAGAAEEKIKKNRAHYRRGV